jgi:hypothetical protein
MVADWEEVGVTEKSCPTPESTRVWGLPGALFVIVKVPVLVPPAVGSKKTPMEQLEPAARLLPQVLSCPKSAGLVAMLVMLRGALPLFVTLTL